MRNQLRHLFVFMLLGAFCLSGCPVFAQKQTKGRRQTGAAIVTVRRPIWEYKATNSLSEEDLNKLGAEGWELAAIFGTPDQRVLYFKRRKK